MRGVVFLVAVFFGSWSKADPALVGGWHFGTFSYPDRFGYVVTFFEDGTYYVAENESFTDAAGFERGNYAYDPVNETLTFTRVESSSNNWPLSMFGALNADLDGDTLTLSLFGPPQVLVRLVDPTSAIVGSWYLGPDEAPRDDGIVVSFLTADGSNPPHYFMAEDGEADEGGMPGMELGDYDWDGMNSIVFNGGALGGLPWFDTTGDFGLSDAEVNSVLVDGDRLTVNITGEGDLVFLRVTPGSGSQPSAKVPLPFAMYMILFFVVWMLVRAGPVRFRRVVTRCSRR